MIEEWRAWLFFGDTAFPISVRRRAAALVASTPTHATSRASAAGVEGMSDSRFKEIRG